ncbi:MAG TPA: PRC-barrel domain-containing protein [Ktedonobacterales bacterium]|nr:PRC-barrel domain-containing protein [Ktedonobacterales bacterium]
MTSSSASQSGEQHPVIEDIDQYLVDGLPVFDAAGERVGTVKMYSTAAGYLMVSGGPLGRENLYIPFRLIRSIDPREIYLTAYKDTLKAQYTQPPAITSVSETRMVPGPLGTLTPQTVHVQMVQSGYDAQQAALSSVDVGSIVQQLALGMAVYDIEGTHVGDITQYDVPRSLLVVEQGIFRPRVLFVPFSAIQSVDRDVLSVYLNLPKDALVKQHAMLPAQAL